MSDDMERWRIQQEEINRQSNAEHDAWRAGLKDEAARERDLEYQRSGLAGPRLERPSWFAQPIVRWGRHRVLTRWIVVTLPLSVFPLVMQQVRGGRITAIPLPIRIAIALAVLSLASPALWTLVGKIWELALKVALVGVAVGVVLVLTHTWGVTLFGHHYGK